MKDFLKENSGVFIKLNLYQFGAAFVGILLVLVAASTESDLVQILASLFSICFHFFIVYTYMWDLGAREKIRVDSNRAAFDPAKGLKLALVANIPNILLGLFVMIFGLLGAENYLGLVWAQEIAVVAKGIAVVWESMYVGIISVVMPTSVFAFMFAVIPQVLLIFTAYYFGLTNKRLIRQSDSDSDHR